MPNPSTTPDLDALLEHGGWVRALARSLVQDPDLADDVEQQTWLTAMQHPPAHGKNLRAWLGSVVRSVAGTHWRAEKARRRRESAVGERQVGRELQPDSGTQPESLAERMDTFRQLAGALSELEEPYGTTLYLRYFEELPVREVARRMQVPEATAQTRIARGLKMLRARLAHTLGSDWRQRCLVFTLPLAKAPWLGPAVVLAMTTKTKILLGAACVALISLLTVKPWAVDPAELDGRDGLQAAVLDASEDEELIAAHPEASISRADLQPAEAVAGLPAATEEGLELVVQVRDAVTLEPAAGAEVLMADYTKHQKEWSLASREECLDDEQLLERFGDAEVVGEDGVYRMPFPDDKVILGARLDGKFAYYFHHPDFYEDGSTVEMLLVPEVSQEVLVVDENGLPVEGAMVGFAAIPLRIPSRPEVFQRTDAKGRAVLRHLEIEIRHDLQNWANTVSLMMPTVESQVQELQNEELGRQVLRFVASPWGEVQVRCRYRDGSPIPDGIPVNLQSYVESGNQEIFEAHLANGLQSTFVEDGIAKFPRVGIGTEVQVASFDWSLGRYMLAVGSGPSRVDEVVDMELVFDDPTEKLTLQLVSPADIPMEAGWMDTMLSYVDTSTGKREGTGQSVYLDVDGRMEIETGAAMEAGSGFLRLQVMHQSIGVGQVGIAPFAIEELDLARAMEEGEAVRISFGESTVVAGKAVDDEGVPLEGITLRLSMEDLAVGKGASERTFNYIEVETAEDGSFRFLGPSGNSRFGYTLTSRSANPTSFGFRDEIPFDFGEEDLLLTFPGGGRIAGRVLLDDMEWSKNLVVVARYAPNAEGHLPGSAETRLEYPNGRFELEHLPADLESLELRHGRGSEILSRLDLTQIATERVDGVERLPDWDLRGELHRHEIHLRTLDEGALQSISCVPGFGTLDRGYFPEDRLMLLSRKGQLDLEIWSMGYRSERVLSGGKAEVVLRPGLPVLLSLPAGVTPPEGARWGIRLHQPGGAEVHRKDLSVSLDEGREVQVHLPHAGTWAIKITMLEDLDPPSNDGDWFSYKPVLFNSGEPWHVLEVKDRMEGQDFVLPITQEAFDTGREPLE